MGKLIGKCAHSAAQPSHGRMVNQRYDTIHFHPPPLIHSPNGFSVFVFDVATVSTNETVVPIHHLPQKPYGHGCAYGYNVTNIIRLYL